MNAVDKKAASKRTRKPATKSDITVGGEETITMTASDLEAMLNRVVAAAVPAKGARAKRGYSEPANPADAFKVIQDVKRPNQVVIFTFHEADQPVINEETMACEGELVKPTEACYNLLRTDLNGYFNYSRASEHTGTWHINKVTLRGMTEKDVSSNADVDFLIALKNTCEEKKLL